jgi:hypothetical protein
VADHLRRNQDVLNYGAQQASRNPDLFNQNCSLMPVMPT